MLDRITFDPKIMGGRACIRGMRITVAHVVNLVTNGMLSDEILEEYPDLEAEDRHSSTRRPSPVRRPILNRLRRRNTHGDSEVG